MGTEKGVKLDNEKPRMDLVLGEFTRALEEVGKVGTFGANKYTDKGWVEVNNGIERYLSAMLRHYMKFRRGKQKDEESGLSHLSHMVWNALAVLELYKRNEEAIKDTMDEVLEEYTNDNFADYIIDYFLDKKQTDELENLEL